MNTGYPAIAMTNSTNRTHALCDVSEMLDILTSLKLSIPLATK